MPLILLKNIVFLYQLFNFPIVIIITSKHATCGKKLTPRLKDTFKAQSVLFGSIAL